MSCLTILSLNSSLNILYLLTGVIYRQECVRARSDIRTVRGHANYLRFLTLLTRRVINNEVKCVQYKRIYIYINLTEET